VIAQRQLEGKLRVALLCGLKLATLILCPAQQEIAEVLVAEWQLPGEVGDCTQMAALRAQG
jgi:hypothetical protein